MPVVEGDPSTFPFLLSLPPEVDLVPTGSEPLFRRIKPTMIQAAAASECLAHPDAETAPVAWQLAMKRAIRSQRELRLRLNLPAEPDADAAERFPTFVPLELLGRIRSGDPQDPILRQVLAVPQELESQPGYRPDPVGDLDAAVAGGLLHKYHGRALIDYPRCLRHSLPVLFSP